MTKREAKVQAEGEKEDSTLNSYEPIVIEENAEGFLMCDGEILTEEPEVASSSTRTKVELKIKQAPKAKQASRSYVRRH